MNTFISVNREWIRIELTPNEKKAYANRIRNAMRRTDEEIEARERDIKNRGTCPICHLVLPLTKYCSNCQKTYR